MNSPPMPQPDDDSRFFWEGLAKGELRIQRCQSCRQFIHYPKPICRICHSTDLAGERVSGQATLYSWTIASQAFHPYWVGRVPYIIASVELREQRGLMMASQIVACEERDLRIGLALEVVFESLDDQLTVPFFRPSLGAGETME